MKLPTIAERVAALRDDATKSELIAEGQRKGLWYDPDHIYPLGNGEYPDYGVEHGRSVAALAAAARVHPVELIIDRLLESDGRELFNVWFFNRNITALGEYLKLDGVCPGLSDAGAQAGQICDADAQTHYLAYWCHARRAVSLIEAVHCLSAKPAAVLGLVDRGTLAVGRYADVNVFDPERLRFGYPTYVNDFPNGKGRLLVKAEGYAVTLVNGQVVTEHGAHTGGRPGRVLRQFSRG